MVADLSPAEVSDAIRDLTPDDLLKLTVIERQLLGGTSFRRHDLFNEAVCRALLGRRKCPADVPVIAFLAQTMKSIASHERERQKRIVHSVDVENQPASATIGVGELATALSPEELVIEREAEASAISMDEIRGVLAGDHEAARVLEGMAREMKGRELRDFAGLDQYRLDYAKARIRKAFLARYPKGWRK